MVEDLLRFVGYGVLKSVTLGRYRSDAFNGLLLEGSIGLVLVASAVFLLPMLLL